ncbi:MAG: helix-turn-helix transcriptional regulator [Desulfobulbaceae bacterium]|nr:helix-turn-helix transcriptional regulator [Desulfobulbaceae bacterium]
MIGNIIRKARQKRGWSLDQLGEAVGLTKGTLSGYETGQKKTYDPDTLCKIADALNDLSILVHHCQSCPVRNHVFLKQFPDLNNIRRDPAIIAARLRKEMIEAADALDRLTERFSDADFKSRPDYMETFMREMEQVIDAKRCIEVLELELILSGTHSSGDLKKVYARQQEKCIAHGHHKPEE